MGSGAGKIRVFTKGDDTVVIIDAATTQTRVLKKYVSSFIKREAASVRPWFGPFEVRIWTSVMAEKRGAHDVDNVAKAVLDAFSGVFWRDDRQVVRLISERFRGDANRIAVRLRPLKNDIEPIDLDQSLLDWPEG
ncbi:MAG: RusA family crossover junction endodeoxyribonuclease [Pseudomonadota bacterium]